LVTDRDIHRILSRKISLAELKARGEKEVYLDKVLSVNSREHKIAIDYYKKTLKNFGEAISILGFTPLQIWGAINSFNTISDMIVALCMEKGAREITVGEAILLVDTLLEFEAIKRRHDRK